MADEDLDLGEEKKSSKKWLFITLGLVLIILIGAGAAAYFMGLFPGGEDSETEEIEAELEESEDKGKGIKESHFFSFEPFIVNFPPNPDARLLQISFSALTYDQETQDAMKKHVPLIRNNLLMLLGRYKPEDLKSRQGKEALLEVVKQEIQKALDLQPEGGTVKAVFVTQFVMQ